MANQKKFFEKYPEGTLQKLTLLRGYFEAWSSLFLTESPTLKFVDHIWVFDFFAGPGCDNQGNDGSPVIILKSVIDYHKSHSTKASTKPLTLVFNDTTKKNIKELKNNTESLIAECENLPRETNVEFCSLPFKEIFQKYESTIRMRNTACLLLMDQFGIKEVTADIFNQLLTFPTTDFVFFIASSFAKRFHSDPHLQKLLPFDPQEIKKVNQSNVHRMICDVYRKLIPQNKEFYIAPFSIKKNSNIYGLVFGSGSLRGIDKFLDVVWKIDRDTGEANFDIDGDVFRDGKKSLFEDMNKPQKVHAFEEDLLAFIRSETPTNRQMYKFCLEKGFAVRVAKDIVKQMMQTKRLVVRKFDDGSLTKNLYINWDNYNNNDRVRFYTE